MLRPSEDMTTPSSSATPDRDVIQLRRRGFLASAAAAGIVAAAPGAAMAAALPRDRESLNVPTDDATARDTFVLVPGAWHGGWVWKKVEPLLRATGADVFSLTNTGLGDRVHLGTPATNLTTHITDVVDFLESRDLTRVTLVGHSYGGMVIAGVADKVPDRLAHLVFLDAFLPRPNTPTSIFDLALGAEAGLTALANQSGDGWKVPQTWNGDPPTFGVTDPNDVAWLLSHLTPQPLKTFSEELLLSTPLEERPFSRSYILFSTAGGPFPPLYATLNDNPAWHQYQLPTGHDAMITKPLELSQLLASIVHP
jgi:pimeloyl-ACP methyl ester carboxylesterase